MSLAEGCNALQALITGSLSSQHQSVGTVAPQLTVSGVAVLVEGARAVERAGKPLPMRQASQLLDVAQRAWNATVSSSTFRQEADETADKVLKARCRQLIAHYFALALNLFSPVSLRAPPLAAHGTFSGKCVLMCLKTVKNLADVEGFDGAAELLDFAEKALALPSDGLRYSNELSVDDLRLEVSFTKLELYWGASRYSDVVDVAKTLFHDVHSNRAYSESLLQLCFTFAEACASADLQFPGEGNSVSQNDELAASALALSSTATEQCEVDVKKEECLQQLLRLSLELQGVGDSTGQKRRALRGTTLLQLAGSLCRTERFDESLRATQMAYEQLQSLEPIALQIEVYARMGDFSSAFGLLKKVAVCEVSVCADSPPTFSTEELFAVARLLVDASKSEGHTRAIIEFLMSRSAECAVAAHSALPSGHSGPESRAETLSASQHFNYCMVGLCLHISTDQAIEAMCTVVDHASECDDGKATSRCCPAVARYYFCACWSVAVREKAAPVAHMSELRALQTALRLSGVASADEVESVLLRMADCCFSLFYADRTQIGPLHECYDAFQSFTHVSVFSDLAQCQMAFLLPGAQSHAMMHARDMLRKHRASEPPLSVVASFGSLVTFLSDTGMHGEAGAVAGLVAGLPQRGNEEDSPQPVEELEMDDAVRLEFLRVCGIGLAAAPVLADTADAICSLCRRALPLLDLVSERHQPTAPTGGTAPAGTPSLMTKLLHWCELLWLFADQSILPTDPALAVDVCYRAVQLFRRHLCDYNQPSHRELLQDRVLFVLDAEFDLFVCGSPHLEPSSLLDLLSLAKENAKAASGAATLDVQCTSTLALAEVESVLRSATADTPGCGVAERRRGGGPTDTCEEELQGNTASGPVSAALSAERLVGAGVDYTDLEALATVTDAIGSEKQIASFRRSAVLLQLAAVCEYQRTKGPHVNGTAPLLQRSDEESSSDSCLPETAAVMLFKAHQLAYGQSSLQLQVCKAMEETMRSTASRSSSPREASPRDDPTLETVVEYFVTECWNKAVSANAARERAQAVSWRELATAFCKALPDANPTKATVTELTSKMPLM